AVDPLGEAFDPKLHEAIGMEPAGDKAPNSVIRVMQKGYVLNDRLVRPAMVVVAK
nr:nucleotide exchange factor GrpE [Pseudomonadota bacterium]